MKLHFFFGLIIGIFVTATPLILICLLCLRSDSGSQSPKNLRGHEERLLPRDGMHPGNQERPQTHNNNQEFNEEYAVHNREEADEHDRRYNEVPERRYQERNFDRYEGPARRLFDHPHEVEHDYNVKRVGENTNFHNMPAYHRYMENYDQFDEETDAYLQNVNTRNPRGTTNN